MAFFIVPPHRAYIFHYPTKIQAFVLQSTTGKKSTFLQLSFFTLFLAKSTKFRKIFVAFELKNW
jgi:hypothetical protein